MSNVKGNTFTFRIQWVRLNQGEAGLRRLARQVSPGLSDLLLNGVVTSRWYPFDYFVELSLALDRMFGRGDLELIRVLGRDSAEMHLTTIYRLFYKVGTVKWILARASRLWALYFDSGVMHVDTFPGREAGLRIEGFSTPHRAHCMSFRGWAERSVELSGGAQVQCDEVACRVQGDPNCRYVIQWS